MNVFVMFIACLGLNANYYNIQCQGDGYFIFAHIEEGNNTLLIDFLFINELDEAILVPAKIQGYKKTKDDNSVTLYFPDIIRNSTPPKGARLSFFYLPAMAVKRFRQELNSINNDSLETLNVSIDYYTYENILASGVRTSINEKEGNEQQLIDVRINKNALNYFFNENRNMIGNSYFFEIKKDSNRSWNSCGYY